MTGTEPSAYSLRRTVKEEWGGPEDTCGDGELRRPLTWLSDVIVAPPRGDQSCLQEEWNLLSLPLQLQFLLSKVNDLKMGCVGNGETLPEKTPLAAAVPRLIYLCQPFFNLLVSTTRSAAFQLQRSSLTTCDIYTKLCDSLEQLVLTYASDNLICLDQTEPNNLSHFCIGTNQLGHLRLTMFRYCKPTPYQASIATGLFKRMRWNVERIDDDRPGDVEREGTEYYFLCYEDVPQECAGTRGASNSGSMRMWSIGRWVQVHPAPHTEDIYNWILCDVPRASYDQLLLLGSEEPPAWYANSFLQELLLRVCDQ